MDNASYSRILDGHALLAAGKADDGRAVFEQILEEHPRSRTAMRGLQDCERSLMTSDQLRARWRAETERRPDDADAWYLYGRAMIEQEQEARTSFDKAIELDPTHPWAAAGLAYLHYRRGDLFAAVQVYETAVRRAPRSARMRLLLANQYIELALYQHARRHLDVAARLAPGDIEVEAALGKVLAETGEEGRALEMLEAVRAAEPRMIHILPTLASLYLGQARPRDADDAYRSALQQGLPARDELAAEIRAALVLAEIRGG